MKNEELMAGLLNNLKRIIQSEGPNLGKLILIEELIEDYEDLVRDVAKQAVE